MTSDDLSATLRRIDGRGYKAYRDIRGRFDFERFTLHVDRVQADPFAAPSHMRVRVPMQEARLPSALWRSPVRRIALADFLAREVQRGMHEVAGSTVGRKARSGSGRSGELWIDAGGQSVLERSAVRITEDHVEARIQVGLPASGRKVLGRSADELLCQALPPVLLQGLLWENISELAATRFVECIENQEHIRAQLCALGVVAFVANGSLLPRRSGADDRPMPADSVVPFESPPRFELEVELANPIREAGNSREAGNTREVGATRASAIAIGMGIPKGVTLIVGGGYHGKSTLLQALERGVYPHIPGDGREGVVCNRETVKIRAEDGRSVSGVNIQAFIGDLPGGRSTRAFSTQDASGSTSQASNILEAIEVGARTLLVDEDTSATNFMVRDARMQALVSKHHEPITPFIDRVRELYESQGISTVLVMGGVGDYFGVADQVLAMRDYRPLDVTDEARKIDREHSHFRRREEAPGAMPAATQRIPLAASLDASSGRRAVKIDAKGTDLLLYGRESIDLHGVAQVEDLSQVRAIGCAIHLAAEKLMDGERALPEVLEALEDWLDEHGIDALCPNRRGDEHPGNLARPRRFEIAAAINRHRGLRLRESPQVRVRPT